MIRSAASRIARAADLAENDLAEALVEQEPQFTDRMLGRITQAIEGYQTKGVLWRAKTLTDRGANAQEKQYGADFVGVLQIEVPGYSVKKGFLAQAKLIRPSENMGKAELERMRHQCHQMLELSPDSFVFSYSPDSVRVIPAIAVAGSSETEEIFRPDGLYSRSIAKFFEEHFASFIGDHRISEPTIDTLERLQARRLLFISATQ